MTENHLNHQVVVINQTNSKIVYSKERKLLGNGALWHKIIINNAGSVDKEVVLKAILNHVYPLDLIPVNYMVEGQNAYFIARNCGPAIGKLCHDNLIVPNDTGREPYMLTIVLGFSNTTKIHLDVLSNIAETIRKRYDSKTGIIDLDSFHKNPELSGSIYCVLSQPKILHFVLQLCKPLQPKVIKLSNNDLRSVSSIEVLWSCKSIVSLDLRYNLIENMISLGGMKSMQIKDLWLDGNPICQNYDERSYIQAVREICPTITKLDGVLLGSEGFLAYRRNFAINHNAESLVDQFLEHFFTLYDSSNRCYLHSLYHKNALFSMSTSYIPSQITSLTTRLEPYKKYSRNLFKLSDVSKSADQLDIGPENITKKFQNLPTTEHDPYTFTVDVLEYGTEKVMFSVTGVFREPATNLQDAECLYCFSRTFVLLPERNGEYKIINELLHVSNATTILAHRSFKCVRTEKSKTLTTLRNVQYKSEKNEFIIGLSKITTLNNEWCRRCLEEAKWDMKKALEIFVDFYKLDKIPMNAFLSSPENFDNNIDSYQINTILTHMIPPGFEKDAWSKLSKNQRKKYRREYVQEYILPQKK